GLATTLGDVDALLGALEAVVSGTPSPVDYVQDTATGDFFPATTAGWWAFSSGVGGGCARS
ncbi:MAG: hypothetical protein ACP5PM_01190, partial [Acidimicrobiales bacterium]